MDPHERAHLLKTYQEGYSRLIAALRQFPREMWEYKPSVQDWSIHEVLVHLADSETIAFIRFRQAIAEPGTEGPKWDQPVWAKELDYQSQQAEESLELFRWLRMLTYRLLQDTPEEKWANTVGHPTRGQINLDDLLTTYANHVGAHIEQMWDVYRKWVEKVW